MSFANNSEFYSARAAAALRLAERATDPTIAEIHYKMAKEYEERASLGSASTALKQVGD